MVINEAISRLLIDFSKCKFSKRRHPGIPVPVVDKEIYNRPPLMMIATVDKFAMMALRRRVHISSTHSIWRVGFIFGSRERSRP